MILKGFKEKSNKNYINSRLKNRIVTASNTKIKRVGVIVNTIELKSIPDFKTLAKSLSVKEENIDIIAFKAQVKKDEAVFNPTYTLKDLGWKGVIKNKELKQFLNTEYHALISYYKADDIALKVFTSASNAQFKIGILEADERINDLIIKTEVNDFKTFTSELKKYLNILNKL
ncbi:DUF6913 domain-containing protein [Lacinutrix chionoecetis]